MLVVDIMWAISAVLITFAIHANTFAKLLRYESWGIGIGGTMLYVLFPAIRNAFNQNIKEERKFALGVMFVNEGIFVLGKMLTFYAYTIGPTALVNVLGSSQVFFGILYGFILTSIAPLIFKEDISKKGLGKKIAFAITLFIG